MDTLGEIPLENRRPLRPQCKLCSQRFSNSTCTFSNIAVRRCSTATSFASHTSKGSSSLTVRSYAPNQQKRRMSKAFTKNMPMNDF